MRGGCFLIHFMRPVCMTLTLKPDKDITRKENYRTISFMNINVKNPQQNLNPANYKQDYMHDQVQFIPGMQSCLNI